MLHNQKIKKTMEGIQKRIERKKSWEAMQTTRSPSVQAQAYDTLPKFLPTASKYKDSPIKVIPPKPDLRQENLSPWDHEASDSDFGF